MIPSPAIQRSPMITALRLWHSRSCRQRQLRKLIDDAPSDTVRDDLMVIAARDAANPSDRRPSTASSK